MASPDTKKRVVLAIAPPFNDNILPISLGIMKALLRERARVTCLDLRLDLEKTVPCFGDALVLPEAWYAEQAARILDPHPDIVGFTVYRSNRDVTLELCRHLKETCRGLIVVLGGPEFIPGYPFDSELFEWCDYVYQGEAETGITEFIDHVSRGEKPDMAGLWVKDGGQFKHTGRRERLQDLDRIPIPDYGDFDLTRYCEIPLQFSRGCDYRCTYCDNSFYFKGQLFRSPESLYAELEVLAETYGKKHFVLVDDSLICSRESKEAFIRFCRLLIEHRMDIRFRIYGIRVTPFLTREDVALMERAGLDSVQIGLESASSRVRRDMGKEPSDEVTHRFLDAFLCRPGIRTSFFMIYGYPLESREEFNKTAAWLEENAHRIHTISFTPFNVNLPYLAKRDNVTLDPQKPRVWTSSDSTFELRFSMFLELLDRLKRMPHITYNLTDPCFVKTYSNHPPQKPPRDHLFKFAAAGRTRELLATAQRLFLAGNAVSRLRPVLRRWGSNRGVGPPFDIDRERAFLLDEYSKRDLV